jgi:hypothetical protein
LKENILDEDIEKIIEERVEREVANRLERFHQDNPDATEARPWSHYKALKEKDHRAWSNTATQKQMLKDAERLGDAFADGDFNR